MLLEVSSRLSCMIAIFVCILKHDLFSLRSEHIRLQAYLRLNVTCFASVPDTLCFLILRSPQWVSCADSMETYPPSP